MDQPTVRSVPVIKEMMFFDLGPSIFCLQVDTCHAPGFHSQCQLENQNENTTKDYTGIRHDENMIYDSNVVLSY